MPKRHDTVRTNAVREQFARNLVAARDEAGLNNTDLATRLKVKPSTVGDWCSGRSAPTLENLVLIASVVRQSLSWLCGDSLHGLDTLEHHQQDLAVRLGGERLRALREISDSDLLGQIDLLIRGDSTAQTSKPARRRAARRKG